MKSLTIMAKDVSVGDRILLLDKSHETVKLVTRNSGVKIKYNGAAAHAVQVVTSNDVFWLHPEEPVEITNNET